MHTAEALLDTNQRAHRSLGKLLDHCAALDSAQLNREFPGFGYPTVRLQLHHVIGAQEYWIGVIQGSFRAEDDEAEYPTIGTLSSYRDRVARMTETYLRTATPAELNTAREMLTWQGHRRLLVPAHVVLRTLTHFYHHQGQVLALCRLLDHPGPGGTDFPLD